MDGSNLATEGRTLPSLPQLDEAVRAYAEEDPDSRITVVVDASFEHRIDESERETLREAMLNGEVVSPPAGAIGRGDAFVLRIAERTGRRRPLQRLVPGVPRRAPLAVRRRPADRGQAGARRGVDLHAPPAHPGPQEPGRHGREARPSRDPESAPAKAAELAKAAKKAAKRSSKKADSGRRDHLAHHAERAAPPPPPAASARRRSIPSCRAPSDEAVAEALDPPSPVKAAKAPAKKKAAAAKKAAAHEEGGRQEGGGARRRHPKKAAAKKAATKKARRRRRRAAKKAAAAKKAGRPRRRRRR